MFTKTFLIGPNKDVHVKVTEKGVTIRRKDRFGKLLVDASLIAEMGYVSVFNYVHEEPKIEEEDGRKVARFKVGI